MFLGLFLSLEKFAVSSSSFEKEVFQEQYSVPGFQEL